MGTWGTSTGDRVTTKQKDDRSSNAKREYKEAFIDKHGYLFCERCWKNNGGLAASHIVSEKWACENGKADLCWDLTNLEILCNDCHMSFENLGNWIRGLWLNARLKGEKFISFMKNHK